jgi:hypothetical protein
MAKSRGAGPTPKVGKLTGKSRGGKSNIKGIHGAAGTGTTDPSQSGNADLVQQRNAAAAQGKMQQKQMKASKSAGLRVGRGRKR